MSSRNRWVKTTYHVLSLFFVLTLLVSTFTFQVQPAAAAPGLSVQIIAAYNLIVDSNVLTPATYQPIVATVIGKVCNTGNPGDAALNNVMAYIGDYVPAGTSTPGTYPVRTGPFTIGPVGTQTTYIGNYSFTHLGGAADASRFIGTLSAGQCVYQYWSFTYPKTATKAGPTTIPAWGDHVKPDDDLSLTFDVWASATGYSANASWTMNFRNEISAMANKIEPNGNPGGRWFNTDTSTVLPGETITTNGILYRLGNVNKGFDNDGDGFFDFNAWLQPFGDPAYDPSCFRLVKTSGVLTVTTSSLGDVIIPFEDNLYFTDLPEDNTNVVGEVFYTFVALGGACTIPITPYQEAASGSDNEKFNGDYGTGIPPLMSYEPEVTVDKTGPASVDARAAAQTINYTIAMENTSTTASAGLTLLSAGINSPAMLQDTIPVGLQYVAAPAPAMSFNYTPASTPAYTVWYSTNGGATWGTTAPADGTTSTTSNPIKIRWILADPMPKSTGVNPRATATFSARVPANFEDSSVAAPVITNCAQGSFGDATPFAEDCFTTSVTGDNSIGQYVWGDDGVGSGISNNGVKDGTEANIGNITVWLYLDAGTIGVLDSADTKIMTTTTAAVGGTYSFSGLSDGRYLVQVDTTDAQITQGYGPTTRTLIPVDLDSGHTQAVAVNDTSANFGFGPSLVIDKHLATVSPINEGANSTFHIDLYNRLPGDGTADGYCRYTVFASATPAGDGTPSSGVGNKAFSPASDALGMPNGAGAFSNLADSADTLGLSGFNLANQSGNVTKVEVLAYVEETKDLQATNDYIELRIFRGNNYTGTVGTDTFVYQGQYFTQTLGTMYELRQTLCASASACAPATGNPWTISQDFANNYTELQIYGSGNGTPANIGNVSIDAVAYRVTTDQKCSGGDTTITVLPFTDTYDSARLEFVSATPMPDAVSAGTLTWYNLGPLYAGGVKHLEVTFKAKDPGANQVSTTNTATASNTYFGNGRQANNATDNASVTINGLGKLSGTVYFDGNNNGWQGSTGYDSLGTNDFGLPNVTLTLYGCYNGNPATGGTLITDVANGTCTGQGNPDDWFPVPGGSTTTNLNGYYEFANLPMGYYYIQASGLPAGATQRSEPVQAGAGANCAGSCNNIWEPTGTAGSYATAILNTTNFNPIGNNDPLTGPNEDINDISFGYTGITTVMIYGTVYNDNNGDRTRDTGENGFPSLAGTTVELRRSDTNALVTTVGTDANGNYVFTGITPGTQCPSGCYVQVATSGLPAGGTGWTNTVDPNSPAGSNGDNRSQDLTLVAGRTYGSLDFGYYRNDSASISGVIYRDWNGNGDQNTMTEEGFSGQITVWLYEDSNGNGVIDATDAKVMTTTTTAGTGAYSFTGLGIGNYIVKVDRNDPDLPSTYKQTEDPDTPGVVCTTCNNMGSVSITTASQAVTGKDFGYQPSGGASIGDTVWNDADRDGVQDPGESGIANITVTLYEDTNNNNVYDSADAVIATASTDANGNYTFSNLPAGEFVVAVDTADPQLPLDVTGVRYVPSNDSVQDVTLTAGQDYNDADFGFRTQSAIGNYAWIDADGDGIHDSNEAGLNGVSISLYNDVNNNGTYDAGTDTLAGTTTTANDGSGNPGYYLFSNLPAGNYVLVATTPGSYRLTGDPDSYNATSDSLSCLTTGVTGCDGIMGFDSRNGTTNPYDVDPGLALGQIDLTADFGFQPLGGALGDSLWIDTDNDGVRDPSERGIPNITVWLCSSTPCSSGNAVATVVSDDNGYYAFPGLTNGNTYYVTANTADTDFPSGLTQTYGTAEQSRTINTSVNNGIDLTVDFGYRYNGINNLNGTVWHDDNGNTNVDVAETYKYQSVPVYAWRCVNGCGGTDDILIGSTMSAANGTYAFNNLPDGTYRVSVNDGVPQLSNMTNTTGVSYTNIDLDSAGTNTNPVTETRNFGFQSGFDAGDLPSLYNTQTKLATNGARHQLVSVGQVYLGSVAPDADPDARTDANANGDETNGGNDEGGVIRTAGDNWSDGGQVDVTAVNGACTTCYVSAWIDWNMDGLFSDEEQVFTDTVITSGPTSQVTTLNVPVPDNYFDGSQSNITLGVRFRVYANSTYGTAQPTGLVVNGEVKDFIWKFTPTNVELTGFAARANSQPYGLLALAVGLALGLGGLVLFIRRKR